LALVNNEIAGAERLSGKLEEANAHEKQADESTPNSPFYHWMLGRRLQDLGMTELAEKHLRQAGQLGASNEIPNTP
jgi:tetratricopeptide (TPR) repeat protein